MTIAYSLYLQLATDLRISNGAFRMWHLFRDMTGKNTCCWPSMRTISESIHCNKNSISKWIRELEDCGYLEVQRGNRHRSNRYRVATKLNYGALLKDPRWQKKRLEIFNRDDWTCQKCGSKSKTLHVHHKRYFMDKAPWDIANEHLTTWCEKCHDRHHG